MDCKRGSRGTVGTTAGGNGIVSCVCSCNVVQCCVCHELPKANSFFDRLPGLSANEKKGKWIIKSSAGVEDALDPGHLCKTNFVRLGV